MTQEQFNELLRSQQGELNAVLMYQRLAKVVKTDKEREAFLQLAREEGGHASVFHVYTKQAIKPKEALSYSVESSWTSQAAKPSAGTNSAVLRQTKRQVDYHNPFGRQPWCCLLYLFFPVYFLEA